MDETTRSAVLRPRLVSPGLLGTQTEDAELAEDDLVREPLDPVRRDPVTFGQEGAPPTHGAPRTGIRV
jgi:hypothetical protein